MWPPPAPGATRIIPRSQTWKIVLAHLIPPRTAGRWRKSDGVLAARMRPSFAGTTRKKPNLIPS
jgi:hypothetical protein